MNTLHLLRFLVTYFNKKLQVIFNIYQLLHQYQKILAASNIQGERACVEDTDILNITGNFSLKYTMYR